MFSDKDLEEISANENQPMNVRLMAEFLLESRKKRTWVVPPQEKAGLPLKKEVSKAR